MVILLNDSIMVILSSCHKSMTTRLNCRENVWSHKSDHHDCRTTAALSV